MNTATLSGATTAIMDAVTERFSTGQRRLLALCGAPASGKSTLAEDLVAQMQAAGLRAVAVPMDGFHKDNRILKAEGLLHRKGAPETFDASGFVAAMTRLKAQQEVILPVFDRARDLAIAGALKVPTGLDWVVVEGNYLAYAATPWDELMALWDFSVRLRVDHAVLRQRSVDRWLGHGFAQGAAEEKADANDMVNSRAIAEAELPCDIEVANSD